MIERMKSILIQKNLDAAGDTTEQIVAKIKAALYNVA